jgi:signal transduction histidine kinase
MKTTRIPSAHFLLDGATESFGAALKVIEEKKASEVAFRVVCVSGQDLGREFRVARYPAVIGRGAVDIALNANDVSRAHARLFRNGEVLWLEDLESANGTFVNGTPIRGRSLLRPGDRIQVGSTILILTRYDDLNERMLRLQRLEATMTALSGMAHDFRNALQIVTLGLDELLELEDGARRAAVDEMKRATAAASDLATRLIRLGRNERVAFEPIQLAVLVAETVKMSRRLVGPDIEVSAAVADDAVVLGSPDELRQALLNLLLNARDAIARSGTISISTRMTQLDRASALAMHLPREGDYIELAVADSGVGMDDSTLAHAFEPFFTTKPAGEGSGLGLAMVHAIVRRHGGTVQIDSELGLGSTVRMIVPAASTQATSRPGG